MLVVDTTLTAIPPGAGIVESCFPWTYLASKHLASLLRWTIKLPEQYLWYVGDGGGFIDDASVF